MRYAGGCPITARHRPLAHPLLVSIFCFSILTNIYNNTASTITYKSQPNSGILLPLTTSQPPCQEQSPYRFIYCRVCCLLLFLFRIFLIAIAIRNILGGC